MRLGGWLHRRLAWLALCAVVFAALAPSVSKWLTASQGIASIDVCSAQGTKRIALDLGKKQAPETPAMADNHCGYCLLQQHSPVIPTVSVTWDFAPSVSDGLPIGSGGTTICKRFVRDAHPTRAPPVFS
jgi:Protein of unknown function (DUF2946)